MGFLRNAATALALLGATTSAIPLGTDMIHDHQVRDDHNGNDQRQLRPIRRAVHKRDEVNNLALRSTTIDLDYVHEETLESGQPFVASIKLGPTHPMLILEEVDDLVEALHCSPHGIAMRFSSHEHARRAKKEWNAPEFIVVTNHHGCNGDGERQPYLVSGARFDEHAATAKLSAKPVAWGDVTKTMALDFGSHENLHALDLETYKVSSDLKKRGSHDLGFSFIDKEISITMGGGFVKQKCIECVGTGTVTLSKGSLTLKENAQASASAVPEGEKITVSHIADIAQVNLALTNFHQKFHFETDIELGRQWPWHILGGAVAIPGLGFGILNWFSIGCAYDPMVLFKAQMYKPFNFTYGFEVNVPDNAAIEVDLIDVFRSREQGFDQTQFIDIPTELHMPAAGVNFSVALRQVIEFGVSLGPARIDPVVLYTDLPKYELSLAWKPDSDDLCNPIGCGNVSSVDHFQMITDFVLDMGAGIDIQLTDQMAINPSITLAAITLAPHTTCLPFGPKTTHTASTCPITSSSTSTSCTSKPTTTSTSCTGKDHSTITSTPTPEPTVTVIVVTSTTVCPVTSTVTSGSVTQTHTSDSTSTIYSTITSTIPCHKCTAVPSTVVISPLPSGPAGAAPIISQVGTATAPGSSMPSPLAPLPIVGGSPASAAPQQPSLAAEAPAPLATGGLFNGSSTPVSPVIPPFKGAAGRNGVQSFMVAGLAMLAAVVFLG